MEIDIRKWYWLKPDGPAEAIKVRGSELQCWIDMGRGASYWEATQ